MVNPDNTEMYELYFEKSPVAMFVVNGVGEYVHVNPAACDLLGYSRDEFLSMTISDIGELEHDPEDEPTLQKLKEGSQVRTHGRLEHKSGRTVDVLFDGVPLTDDRFIAYCQDITKQKEYEQRLEEQRDSLTLLNQVIRHDIRNDLQLVTAYADLIEETSDDEEVLDHIRIVSENANHAVELTETGREMATLMLSETDKVYPVSLDQVLANQINEAQSAYPEAIITTEESVPDVDVSANDMLDAVFRNLLKNAVQHNDKDTPRVTVFGSEQDETVLIKVADNGPGIPDSQKETLFGKGEAGLESNGAGIGLYLVQTLVTNYGGDVWVEDNDPTGSIFVVEVPKAA